MADRIDLRELAYALLATLFALVLTVPGRRMLVGMAGGPAEEPSVSMRDARGRDLWTLAGAEAARLIAAGEITSEALVRACLDRIAARDAEVGAWIWLDPELALARAREADRVLARRQGAGRCTACRSASRTSSRRATCRPRTAIAATRAGTRTATRSASASCATRAR